MNFSLGALDRRLVYALVLLALTIPLVAKWRLTPAPMHSAALFFDQIEQLSVPQGKFVLVLMDFGPNSKAENFPQSEVIIEHLLRNRVPFAVASQYLQAEPLLESIPSDVAARLMRKYPGETWEYGRDWVNLGYRVGGAFFFQGMSRANDLRDFLSKDARGNDLKSIKIFDGVGDLSSVALLAQFSSLTGTLETLLQFFQSEKYRPPFVHGCTSITIPAAYIFLDSGQLKGLLEGIAGAASYSAMLDKKFPGRDPDRSSLMMTGLGVAHVVVILLVLLGNVSAFLRRDREGA